MGCWGRCVDVGGGVKGDWRKLRSDRVQELCCSPNTVW